MNDYTRVPRKLKKKWQARDNAILILSWIGGIVLFCWFLIWVTGPHSGALNWPN